MEDIVVNEEYPWYAMYSLLNTQSGCLEKLFLFIKILFYVIYIMYKHLYQETKQMYLLLGGENLKSEIEKLKVKNDKFDEKDIENVINAISSDDMTLNAAAGTVSTRYQFYEQIEKMIPNIHTNTHFKNMFLGKWLGTLYGQHWLTTVRSLTLDTEREKYKQQIKILLNSKELEEHLTFWRIVYDIKKLEKEKTEAGKTKINTLKKQKEELLQKKKTELEQKKVELVESFRSQWNLTIA